MDWRILQQMRLSWGVQILELFINVVCSLWFSLGSCSLYTLREAFNIFLRLEQFLERLLNPTQPYVKKSQNLAPTLKSKSIGKCQSPIYTN